MKVNQWFPAKERLPKIDEPVLIFSTILPTPTVAILSEAKVYNRGSSKVIYYQTWEVVDMGEHIRKEYEYISSVTIPWNTVTHWMPLPESPKEEKK